MKMNSGIKMPSKRLKQVTRRLNRKRKELPPALIHHHIIFCQLNFKNKQNTLKIANRWMTSEQSARENERIAHIFPMKNYKRWKSNREGMNTAFPDWNWRLFFESFQPYFFEMVTIQASIPRDTSETERKEWPLLPFPRTFRGLRL